LKRLLLSALLLLSANSLSDRVGFAAASGVVHESAHNRTGKLGPGLDVPGNESAASAIDLHVERASTSCSSESSSCGLGADAQLASGGPGQSAASTQDHVIGRYDITQFGAGAKGSTDDTTAIQAAFTACWNRGASIAPGSNYGGVVVFPGAKSYVIRSTIYTYDSCRLEGSVNAQGPSEVRWNGPAAGITYNITSFTVAANSTPYYPAYSPKQPPIPPLPATITFPTANSVRVDDWVLVSGFSSSTGISINNTVAQVVAASSDSFTVVVPFMPASTGAVIDKGTVTTINVMFASDVRSRYYEDLRDISFRNQRGIPKSNYAGVDFYFGSRVDSGTKVWGAWSGGALYYGFYFSQGGIDIDFDKGWRADDPGIAGIYWRVSGGDNFGIANGTVSTNSGAGVMLDNSACGQGNMVRFTSRNMGMEVENAGLAPGLGMFMLLDCPKDVFPVQFAIDMENTRTAPDRGAVNFPTIVMTPPNDLALNLNIVNGIFPNGVSPNKTERWVGIPSLTRYDASGPQGEIPSLVYAPALTSSGNLGTNYNSQRAMSQCIGDCNIGQLWQYGIHASAFLYSDTAFAALPNATTLFAGQILAPPSYWLEAGGRYVFDVVYKPGTAGVPNGGETTCQSTNHGWQLVCSSANDLSIGQHVNVGTVRDAMITRIDATDPTGVLLTLNENAGTISTATPMSFHPPELGPEIQLPTKSRTIPNSDGWEKGDIVENGSATSNGTAAWVNVTGGKQGTWAGIPLGDGNGKINSSQITDATGTGSVVLAKAPTVVDLRDTGTANLNNLTIHGTCIGCNGRNVQTAQAYCAGTATPSSTLTMFGAGSATASCASAVSTQSIAQLLMNDSGTLRGFAVRCAHTGANPSSGVFSVWDLPSGVAMEGPDSGVNTGLTVTYGTVKANTTLFDTIHTFAYTKGDLMRIQFTSQANETLGECQASFNY